MISAGFLVRVTGFEPAASWSQTGTENFFRTFPMIFHHFRSYSVTLVPSFEPPFPPVPRASVVIHVVKKRFPTKKDGKRFLCSKCLHCNSGQRVMQVVSARTAVQRLRCYRQRIAPSRRSLFQKILHCAAKDFCEAENRFRAGFIDILVVLLVHLN